jgi:hypothetical protein
MQVMNIRSLRLPGAHSLAETAAREAFSFERGQLWGAGNFFGRFLKSLHFIRAENPARTFLF